VIRRIVRRSLRARLVLAAGGSIILAVALFAAAAVLLVRHELRSSLDSALRLRAFQVAELSVSAPAVLTAPGALESPVSGRQIAVEVLDAHGTIIARSLALGAHLLPEGQLARQAISSGRTGFADVRVDGRPYRLYAAPIAQAGGPAAGGAVLVASDTGDITDTIGHLGLVVALSGLGAALIGVLAAAVLTRGGLGPLRRLAVAGEEIERTADPSRRLPVTGSGDEVGQLTGVLNRMLAALQDASESERRFLADASHELRTPVTTLLGNVEFLARHGANEDLIADLERDAGRLARLVDSLLVLERASTAVPVAGPVELDTLIAELVGTHRPNGRVHGAEIERVTVEGDQEELKRAIENLIENGLVHGPESGAVTVSLRRDAGRALVLVSDEGPGPAPGDRDHLFERFWRGSDATERPGSGLGLSIVSEIVRRHGGIVSVDGSVFTIQLPELRSGEFSRSS
jgi:two-component system sensor histidine kinase MprB